jgi:steroid delta-isomerase-like uncharacterized protein
MSLEENREVARRFIGAWNASGRAVVDDLASPDLVVTYPHFEAPIIGRTGFRQMLEETHRFFPDMRIEVDDLVVERDRAVVVWTYEATHREGELFGRPAAGAKVRVSGMTIYTIEDGRVREERGVVDNLSLMAQLQEGGG